MEEISNVELRNRLRAHGFESPPVTGTTRGVLLKKLAHLEQIQSASNLAELSSAEEDAVVNKSEIRSKRRTLLPSAAENTNTNLSPSKTLKVTSKFSYVSPVSSGLGISTPRSIFDVHDGEIHRGSKSGAETGNNFHREQINNFGRSLPRSTTGDRISEIKKEVDGLAHSTPKNPNDPYYFGEGCYSQPSSVQNVRNWCDSTSWLLLLFLQFFLGLAFVYYYNTSSTYHKTGLTDLSILRCDANQRPNVDCLQNFGLEATKTVLEDVYQILQELAITAQCENNPEKAIYPKDQLFNLLMRRYKFYNLEAQAALTGFEMIAELYSNLSIVAKENGLLYANPSVPVTCGLRRIFSNFFDYLYRFFLVFMASISVLFITLCWKKWRDSKKRELQQLMHGIIDVMQKQAATNPKSPFLPISYVNNQLIPAADRQKKQKLWEEAVKLIESSESRIRREIEPINGEEYVVWRWLLSESPILSAANDAKRRKTWQGEAFGTTKGTMNSPTVSPTQCLKIRHMFDPTKEGTSGDLLTQLQNAILERCEGIRILHIAVDESNPEGCIYVKCACAEDAGKAYRKMHGAWFDGQIVSVKYIRLERYHERFPESVSLVEPLVPTNNLKSSLQ